MLSLSFLLVMRRLCSRCFEEGNATRNIYYKRSIDGGASWGPPFHLTDVPEESHFPSIAVDGDTVHVMWWDKRTGSPQIFYKRSLDGFRPVLER